jgi:hypothetical protein
MRKSLYAAALAACIGLPAIAGAQTPGVCKFDGTASIPSGLGSAPKQNVPFTFGGTLSDVGGGACGFKGNTQATGTMVVATCEGNVHQATASTPVGTVDFKGVCVGAVP